MIGKEAEYNTLRDEIISSQANQCNLLIAMYTISIAIFSFAIDKENPLLFLAVIYIAIPFRMQIFWRQNGILKISAYIIVNFENAENELNWEKNVIQITELRENRPLRAFYETHKDYYAANFLGLLAVVFNIYYLLMNYPNLNTVVKIADVFIAVFSVIFMPILEKLFSLKKTREGYIDDFKRVNKINKKNKQVKHAKCNKT